MSTSSLQYDTPMIHYSHLWDDNDKRDKKDTLTKVPSIQLINSHLTMVTSPGDTYANQCKTWHDLGPR